MNTQIKVSLDQEREERLATLAALNKLGVVIETLANQVHEDCSISWYSTSCYIALKNREDLKVFMQLAPKWNKSTLEDKMQYRASIDGFHISLSVGGEALPASCHVEEVEETVPAREAYTHKVKRIVCRRPDEDADVPAEVVSSI